MSVSLQDGVSLNVFDQNLIEGNINNDGGQKQKHYAIKVENGEIDMKAVPDESSRNLICTKFNY